MNIRLLTIADVEEASQLIKGVSEIYTRKDFSEEGYEKFQSTVLFEGMSKNLTDGFFYWGAYENEQMVGMIAIKRPAHLFNLFVHQDHQGKGIASKLWEYALSQLNPKQVTVFSSTYAVGLYEKLGFVQSGDKIENNEIICYPMLWSAD